MRGGYLWDKTQNFKTCQSHFSEKISVPIAEAFGTERYRCRYKYRYRNDVQESDSRGPIQHYISDGQSTSQACMVAQGKMRMTATLVCLAVTVQLSLVTLSLTSSGEVYNQLQGYNLPKEGLSTLLSINISEYNFVILHKNV